MRPKHGVVGDGVLNCYLLGIHSSRLDVVSRDVNVDEALGLNCAWYSDILMTLTEDSPEQPAHRKSAGRRSFVIVVANQVRRTARRPGGSVELWAESTLETSVRSVSQ
jgi:hypothetical protein